VACELSEGSQGVWPEFTGHFSVIAH